MESVNYYRILLEKGLTEREALEILAQRSRDNGRTPMQWTPGKNAGFTQGEPWIGIPENSAYINVETEEQDPDSILHFYRALVALRKEHPVIAAGDIRFLDTGNDAVFAYERNLDGKRLTVVCSFAPGEEQISFTVPEGKPLIGNYPDAPAERNRLRPFEACAVLE